MSQTLIRIKELFQKHKDDIITSDEYLECINLCKNLFNESQKVKELEGYGK